MTGDIDITYSIPGASITEAYSASGIDFAVKYDFDDSGLFAKVGNAQLRPLRKSYC